MANKRITLEKVRLRLKELHPGVHTSASVSVWSHGGVGVHLTVHPESANQDCWSIFANEYDHGTDEQEARVQKALRKALKLAEAGTWQKPPAAVAADLAAARAD